MPLGKVLDGPPYTLPQMSFYGPRHLIEVSAAPLCGGKSTRATSGMGF